MCDRRLAAENSTRTMSANKIRSMTIKSIEMLAPLFDVEDTGVAVDVLTKVVTLLTFVNVAAVVSCDGRGSLRRPN